MAAKQFSYFQKSLWEDPVLQGMSPDHRAITIFLRIGPFTNYCGIFKIDLDYIANHLGKSSKEMEVTWKSYVASYPDLVSYDRSTKEVGILDWVEENLLRASRRAINRIPGDLKKVKSEMILRAMNKSIKSRRISNMYLSAAKSIAARRMNKMRGKKAKMTHPVKIRGFYPDFSPNSLIINTQTRKMAAMGGVLYKNSSEIPDFSPKQLNINKLCLNVYIYSNNYNTHTSYYSYFRIYSSIDFPKNEFDFPSKQNKVFENRNSEKDGIERRRIGFRLPGENTEPLPSPLAALNEKEKEKTSAKKEKENVPSWSQIVKSRRKYKMPRSVRPSRDGDVWSRRLWVFDNVRKQFPGKKRGLHYEFDNLIKSCKEHEEHIDDVLKRMPYAVKYQDMCHRKEFKKNGWTAQWPMFSTWLNQCRWEEEDPILSKGDFYRGLKPEIKNAIKELIGVL